MRRRLSPLQRFERRLRALGCDCARSPELRAYLVGTGHNERVASVGRRRRKVVLAVTAPLFALATLACAVLSFLFFIVSRLPGLDNPGAEVAEAILFGILGIGGAVSGLFLVRRLATAWTIGIGLAVALIAAALIVGGAWSAGFGSGAGATIGRKHLEPIPIAASACPYVIALHESANNFQIAMPLGSVAFDAHFHAMSWPQTRARFDTALRTLELSILVSRPHFPARIRHQLTVTLGAARKSVVQLAAAKNGDDLYNRTTTLFENGKQAFGYASDLVGDQCVVTLSADSCTLLYPAATTRTCPSR